jgi:iron complex outermembrane recepter protein
MTMPTASRLRAPRQCSPMKGGVVRSCVMSATLAAFALPCFADADLEEVVVTAQRRAENAQDVPIAISAFSANDLERSGVRQAGDITTLVPNLLLSSPYGEEASPVFSLRGVTSNDFSQNQSAPVAMYVDEVYRSVGALQALQTYDLERVEVLRGPQGTLYGKNSTGGAISFFTRNPDLQKFGGYATAGAGNYSGYTVEGAIGGPIKQDELGWRAAVYYNKRDGWLKSVIPGVEPANGIDALGGRLTFLAKNGDAFTAQLKLTASRSRGTPYGVRPANNDPNVTGGNPPTDFYRNAALSMTDKVIDNEGASLKMDWKVADHAVLTSVTGFDYGRWVMVGDDASVGVQLWGADTYASSVHQLSQELRLASVDTDRYTWIVGAYYGQDKLHGWLEYHYFDAFPYLAYTDANGNTVQLYGFDQANSFDQVRSSRAAFANVSFDVTPTITLRGGVRYTKDKLAIKNFFALNGGLAGPPTFQGPGIPTQWTQSLPVIPSTYVDFSEGIFPRGATYPDLHKDNSNVSYRGGIDWKPTKGQLYYLSVSRGFRGAAFNANAFNYDAEVTFADPEEITSYEIGAKTEFLDRRLQVNAAVFHYDYKNQQFLDTYTANGVLLYRELNAPKSRVQGAELELRAKLSEALEVRANFGYTDSEYREFLSHGSSVAGNVLPLAPKVTSSVGFDWRVGTLLGGDFRLNGDAFYYGKQYFDPTNLERIAQSSYTVVNARASLAFGTDRQYSVSLWGKNLFETKYITYALAVRDPEQGGLGLDYTVPAEPRTFGISGSVRF